MDEKYIIESTVTTGQATYADCIHYVCIVGKLPDLFSQVSDEAGSVQRALRHGTLTRILGYAMDTPRGFTPNHLKAG